MKLYSIDVKLYATAYIKANTEEEAREIAKGLMYSSPIILDAGGDVEVSGAMYDNAPDISLSPAMTIHGPDDDAYIEEAHDYGDDEGEGK